MAKRFRIPRLFGWLTLLGLVGGDWNSAAAQNQQQSGAQISQQRAIVEALPRVPAGLNEKYALRTSPAKRINAAYTFSVEAPQLQAKEWLLIAAVPPDLPGQRILGASAAPASVVIEDLSPLTRKLFRVRAKAGEATTKRMSLAINIEAELFARRLISSFGDTQDIDPPAPLSEHARMLALLPTEQFNYGQENVQRWLADHRLTRGANEGEVDFARRVYLHIVHNFTYDLQAGQDRTAGFVCGAGRSDCGGMAAAFVAALRSQGIPARSLCGRWATSAAPGERYHGFAYSQQHVKAEFFANGVGWVPVDLSSAVLHDRSEQKLHFFGADDGDFITLHIDGDVAFDTLYFGEKSMPYLQNASYWATGSGSFDGVKVEETWTVKQSGGPEQ